MLQGKAPPYKNRLSQFFAASLTMLWMVGTSSALACRKTPSLKHSKDANQISLLDHSARRYAKNQAAIATLVGEFRAMMPDGQGVITYSSSQHRSYLYRFNQLIDLDEVAFAGEFQTFTPDGKGLLTYNRGESRLFDLNGTEQAIIKGAFVSFTPDQQSILVVDDLIGEERVAGGTLPIRLYGLNGQEQAFFEGNFEAFMPDGLGLIIQSWDAEWQSITQIFSFGGSHQATLEGSFVAFTPDGQGLLTNDHELGQSNLYRLDGTIEAVLEGNFQEPWTDGLRMGTAEIEHQSGFTPDRQGIITSANNQSWLYDRQGTLQKTLSGNFRGFTADGRNIVTDSSGGLGPSWLYGLDGSLQRAFDGNFVGTTPDEKGVIISLFNQTELYDLAGHLQTVFDGEFQALMPSGCGLITRAHDTGRYQVWLYDTLESKEPITLDGLLTGFTTEGDGIITAVGVYGPFHLYRADGTFVATSRTWPESTPDGSGYVVSDENYSYLYDLNWTERGRFSGMFQTFTADGQYLITYVEANEQSWLYRLSRSQVSLKIDDRAIAIPEK